MVLNSVEKTEIDELLNDGRVWLSGWFSLVKQWELEDMETSRFVWLQCEEYRYMGGM